MTKLRASGASVLEVNAFTCHILTSTVVDAFYYRPIQRDLGTLLIQSVSLQKPKEQSQCSDADYELRTFVDQDTTTSTTDEEFQEEL
ncbi:MAG: hypothetical protein EZS28_051869 [Streblomastix strix]|uniref:Uncharacterized protein n=1 Tax=Streblomastix strix TaxID=222440 RepID=A0A5J4SXG9_9EUKA|nr:MAG: hypothetical protein EZS28_051869 [Streblomastix strix]